MKTVVGETSTLSDLDIDVEDYASLVLRHADGVRSEIHLDYLRPWKRRGCEIVGTAGSLIWNSEGKQPEACTVRYYSAADQHWETLVAERDLDNSSPYLRLMESFVSALSGNESQLHTGREAALNLATALAARRAGEQGSAQTPATI